MEEDKEKNTTTCVETHKEMIKKKKVITERQEQEALQRRKANVICHLSWKNHSLITGAPSK